MYLVNHFLDIELFAGIKIPNQIEAPKTNSLSSIDKQVNLCRGMWGRTANVVLVSVSLFGHRRDRVSTALVSCLCKADRGQKLDWINIGEAIKAQSQYNA